MDNKDQLPSLASEPYIICASSAVDPLSMDQPPERKKRKFAMDQQSTSDVSPLTTDQPSTFAMDLDSTSHVRSSGGLDLHPDPYEYEKRRLYTSEVLGMWNISKLILELGSREQCIAFAEQNGLIPVSKQCRTHRKPMLLHYGSNHNKLGAFVCYRGNCRATSKVSRGKNTLFENILIPLPLVFYLAYSYAHKFSYELAKHEDITRNSSQKCMSSTTICAWYNYYREAVVLYQLDHQTNSSLIGGPGKVVQIDKCKIAERKSRKGKHIEGKWVLGLVEDNSEDLRLEMCPDPDDVETSEVLIPLIVQKHVAPGTTIRTDDWKPLDCLADCGYIHEKINHSNQRIKSEWHVVKRFFNMDISFHSPNFADLILECLWRREVSRKKIYPFVAVITAIKYTYRV